MNFFRPGPGARLALAGSLIIVVTCAALAAPGDPKAKPKDDKTKAKADIHHPAVAVKFDATAVKINAKDAIAHKPHKVIDQTTKKEVSADQELTLPNGKKVKAGPYLAELNKIEKKLNESGHSLHDKGKVTLAKAVQKTAEMEKKAATMAAKHKPFDPKTMKAHAKRSEMAAKFKANAGKDKARIEAMKKHLSAAGKGDAKEDGAGKGTVKGWHWELGRRKIVAAYLDAKLETRGSKQEVSILGEGGAGGYLINHQLSMLKATGSVRVPNQGQSHARVSVAVLGKTIFNKDYPATTSFNKSDQKSITIDKSVSFRFALGPIPMKVTLGAQGSVGVRYFIGLRPLYAEAQFVPFANVRAYAQAGIDIVVASAGVGGQLRLLDFELRIGGKLVVHFDQSKGASLEEHAYVWSKLEMLSGSLFLYAEVTVPVFGIPPWEKKHIEWDLWKWKGFKKSGYLVNVHKTQPLGL